MPIEISWFKFVGNGCYGASCQKARAKHAMQKHSLAVIQRKIRTHGDESSLDDKSCFPDEARRGPDPEQVEWYRRITTATEVLVNIETFGITMNFVETLFAYHIL